MTTLPLVVKEAAAMACSALLVKGSNAAAEASMDNVNSFLCDEATPESIAQRIVEALSDREKLLEVGQTCSKTLVQPGKDRGSGLLPGTGKSSSSTSLGTAGHRKLNCGIKFNIRAKTRG